MNHPYQGSNSNIYQYGFTLTELIIVITLVAIMASMAAPSFNNQLARQRIKEASSTFQLAFKDAKAESLIQNDTITVAYNDSTKVIESSTSNNRVIGKYNLDGDVNITISPSTLTTSSVTKFQFRKEKIATPATITFCDDRDIIKEGTQISLSSTANINIKGVTCS